MKVGGFKSFFAAEGKGGLGLTRRSTVAGRIKRLKKVDKLNVKKDRGNISGVNVSVHPLFFALGLYYAACGKFLQFIVYATSAVLHEFGHAYAAKRRGYALNSITLNVYGAKISGDFRALKKSDDFAIALSGPSLSLLIAFFTAGSWWFFPETYPVTQIIYEANLCLGLVNLLPVKQLDGGLALGAVVEWTFGKKIKKMAMNFIGVAVLVALFVLFIRSCVYTGSLNFSLLFFLVFLLIGFFERGGCSEYALRRSGLREEDLRRGVAVVRFAVSENTSAKRLFALSDFSQKNEFDVYSNGKRIGTVSDEDVEYAAEQKSVYVPLGEILRLKNSR